MPEWREDTWERAFPILEQALSMAQQERKAHIAKSCIGDSTLQQLIERALEGELEATSFLQPPLLEKPSGEPMPGRVVGVYRLVEELGRGGMGAVWLAERSDEIERKVAIKFVRFEGSAQNRFQREQQVLAGLEHPCIARFLDAGSVDGRPYLVLEYVDGVALDRYCDEERLGILGRVRLFLQVLDAVEFAHQRLIVHRDLKPSNILVDKTGKVKLLDFGISKLMDEGGAGEATWTGETPMTPRYASPEQIQGSEITVRADVYSLGVVLYELLCRCSPYPQATTAVQLIRAVCEGTPPPPSQAIKTLEDRELPFFGRDGDRTTLRGRLRRELDWIVKAALQKEPDRRYSSVERMGEDLLHFLERKPVSVGPGHVGYVMGKLVKRHKLPVGASLGACALLIGALTSSWLSNQRAVLAAERDVQSREITRGLLHFTSDVFGSANAQNSLGPEAPLKELIIRATLRADQIENPYVRVAAYGWLGAPFHGLDDPRRLVEMASRGIEFGEAHEIGGPDLAMLRMYLAQGLQMLGENDGVLALYDRALEDLSSEEPSILHDSGTRRSLIEDVKFNRLTILELEQPEAAPQKYEEERQALIERHGPDHREVLMLEFNQLAMHINRGQIAGSRDGLERLFARALSCEDDAGYMRVLTGYAHALVEVVCGDLAATERVLEAIEPIAAEHLGEGHSLTCKLRMVRGFLHLERGEREEGLRLARGLQESSIYNQVDEGPMVLVLLGSLQAMEHPFREAEELLQRSLQWSEADDPLFEAYAHTTLAQLQLAEGQEVPARKSLARARTLLMDRDLPATAPVLRRLETLAARLDTE